MSHTKSSPKAVTPASVKALVLIEAGIIGFLSYWVMSEYVYNAYFRTYVVDALLGHVTTFTALLGLGIGLAGTAVAATLYKNVQRAKHQLEIVAVPKIRGAVQRVLSGIPNLGEHSPSGTAKEADASQPAVPSVSSPVTAIVSVPEQSEQKKQSS